MLALTLLAALALGLMLPALLAPPMVHGSFWIDFVWIEQFTAELRRGVLYPRWLPQSNGGLGAPVFYYYAPLAFYWAGLFGLLGLGPYGSLLAASGSAWLASGLAMRLWLRDCGRRALPMAALYMALPYHVIDFYRRGAFAEFCVYAILPLLALAMRRAATGRGWGALAFAYAALILTHLPLALLTSLMLLAPWGAWLVWRERRAAPPLALGLAFGLALAAVYLVPALTLQRYVSLDQLWTVSELHASNWSFFTPSRWSDPASVMLFIGLTSLLAVTAAVFVGRGDRWALWAIAACAIVAGVVPGLWDVPLLATVQFPWRALLLVEFAVATAIARSRLNWRLTLAAVAPLLLLSQVFDAAVRSPSSWAPSTLAARHADVLEYLPHGASRERGSFSSWALDLARHQPALVHEGDRTIVASFYFPAWRAECGGQAVATAPDPATKLLSYRGEGCMVRRVTLPAEWIGGGLSLAALLILLGLTLRRMKKGPEASPPSPSVV